MYKEFDADEAELTRTKKLRRGALAAAYPDLLAALFGNRSEVKMDTMVSYQDGKERQISVVVYVENVEGSKAN